MTDILFESYRPEWDSEMAQLDSTCEKIRQRLSWINRHIITDFDPQDISVAFHDNRVMGTAMMRVNTYRYQNSECLLGYLSDVAVHPDFQKQGLGRILSERAIAAAEKKGAEGVILFTSPENIAAYRLYQKLGFQDLTKQFLLVWNQQECGKENSLKVRRTQQEDKENILSLIRQMFKDHEMYTERHTMLFNLRGELGKPGVSTYVVLNKSEIVGCINIFNFAHIWQYHTPSGLTVPLLLYNFSVKEGYSKAEIFNMIMHTLSPSFRKISKLIGIMIDEKETELLSILQGYGFGKMVDGVWMGKSLNRDFSFKTFKRPIYNGFPI